MNIKDAVLSPSKRRAANRQYQFIQFCLFYQRYVKKKKSNKWRPYLYATFRFRVHNKETKTVYSK